MYLFVVRSNQDLRFNNAQYSPTEIKIPKHSVISENRLGVTVLNELI